MTINKYKNEAHMKAMQSILIDIKVNVTRDEYTDTMREENKKLIGFLREYLDTLENEII